MRSLLIEIVLPLMLLAISACTPTPASISPAMASYSPVGINMQECMELALTGSATTPPCAKHTAQN